VIELKAKQLTITINLDGPVDSKDYAIEAAVQGFVRNIAWILATRPNHDPIKVLTYSVNSQPNLYMG